MTPPSPPHLFDPARLGPEPLAIYGTGGCARALLARLRALGRQGQVRFFLDSFHPGELDGLPVLHFPEALDALRSSGARVVIASAYHQEISDLLRLHGVGDALVALDANPRLLTREALALLPPDEKITILDIGARRFEEGFALQWRDIPHHRLSVIGFEPDPAECQRMQAVLADMGVEGRFHPCGLWDADGEMPFYTTSPPLGSSCLEPDEALAARYRYSWADQATDMGLAPVRRGRTNARRLDSLAEELGPETLGRVDYANLDVQGGELAVLNGGRRLLSQALCLKLEIWFQRRYRGCALFAEVDSLVRAMGFELFAMDLSSGVGRTASPVNANRILGRPHSVGQVFTSDALYFADPADPHSLGPVRRLKLAILAEIMGQIEFAFEQFGLAADSADLDGLCKDALVAGLARAAAGYQAQYREPGQPPTGMP